jgi:hypothetical protein
MDPKEVLARLEASGPGDDIGYRSAAEAMWDLLHHRHSVLPKLVFYIRFFVNTGHPRIGPNKLFLVNRSEMDLFSSGGGHGVWGKDSEERLWRMVLGSRLSEWTGCGHFASVMRHHLYFASRDEEERAASQSTFTRPTQLLNHLDSAVRASEEDGDEEKGLIIRVEFSAYDSDEWDKAGRGTGPKPNALDFHAYLIDIPSAGPVRDHDDGDDQEPAAYVVQSLWEHYDVSVRPISAGDLRRHLRFLALFDGRTEMTNGQRCRLTHPSFWDVPLPRTKGRPRPSHNSPIEPYLGSSLDPLLERLESHHDQQPHDDVVVSVLDVFSVAAYDSGETKRRLADYLRQAQLEDDDGNDGWGEQTLPYGLPNLTSSIGPPRRAWSEVLSAVDQVHAATEAKHKKAGMKNGRVLPLVDYLPSPHPDTKHRYRSSAASDSTPDHKRRGKRKGRDGTKQRSRCTLS